MKEVVRTDEHIDNLPADKRILELERKKEQKKLELENALAQKEEELRRAEEEYVFFKEQAEEELAREEEQQEQEHKKRKDQEALEETVLGEDVLESSTTDTAVGYEGLMGRIPATVYAFTDYNVYRELLGIESMIENRGYARSDELSRIGALRDQSSIIRDAYSQSSLRVIDEHRNNYLQRTEGVLARLDKKMHDMSGTMGDGFGHVYKQ